LVVDECSTDVAGACVTRCAHSVPDLHQKSHRARYIFARVGQCTNDPLSRVNKGAPTLTATPTTQATAAPDTSNVSPVSTVAVIGFGTMGSGIAQVCAQAGIDVCVVEPSAEVIERDLAAIDKQLTR